MSLLRVADRVGEKLHTSYVWWGHGRAACLASVPWPSRDFGVRTL